MRDAHIVRKDDHTTRVLIADADPSFRKALKERLAELTWVQVVGETGNGAAAVQMAEDLRPDLVLITDSLTGLSGVLATRRIKAKRPKTCVFFLAEDGADRDVAFSAGAAAFLDKGNGQKALRDAIQKFQAQRRWPARAPEVKPPRHNLRFDKRAGIALGSVGGLALLAALIFFPKVTLPLIALLCGLLFLLYGLKYYGSVALILLATSGAGNANGNGNGNGNGLNGIFNGLGVTNGIKRVQAGGRVGLLRTLVGRALGWDPNSGAKGLRNNSGDHEPTENRMNDGNGYHFKPGEQPFVSIHLPLYNETRVVDRLLQACTCLDYQNYEVLVADDSNDETVHHLEKWAKHPKVRISHRINRTGFKGAALKHAMEVMDPRTSFVVIFDADFIPPPNVLHQFLSYFYAVNGNNGFLRPNGGNGKALELVDESLAVVQGYQWHVLNASENWITRGVRTEFSGSYVVERPGQELTAGMKMISGSVFMIRADLLRSLGWGTSITEDWELTIRLYLGGYRVLYSPFIQAPAECVSDFKQLARQRMRWAEGHTFNVKKYCLPILLSKTLTRREKLEFIYYIPYYLQSAFFIVGTLAWLVSEIFLRSHLPFWTATLGWSLVFTNTFALLLMNVAGLFLERGVRRNWAGLLSFILLTFLLVPYQAYAALKGLLEPHEGGWHRTDKTGVITEMIDRLGLGRRMRHLMPKRRRRPIDLEKRLGLPAAKVWGRLPKPVRNVLGRAGRRLRPASGLASGLLILAILMAGISQVEAAVGEPQNVLYFHNVPRLMGYKMDTAVPTGTQAGVSESVSYFSDTWQDGRQIVSGDSTVSLWLSTDSMAGDQTLKISLNAGSQEGGWTTLGTKRWTVNTGGDTQFLSTSFFSQAYDLTEGEQLRLDVNLPSDEGVWIGWDGDINTPGLRIPTNQVSMWSLTLLPAIPLALYLMSWLWRRRKLALRMVSLLLACCVTLGLLATRIQKAGAAPNYDVNTGTTFWLYDDPTPLTYMMYQTQPSGSSTNASNTIVNFYSETWPNGWQVNNGTSTVYFYVSTTGVRSITFTVYAGTTGSWTSLGSGTWSANQGSIALVSQSFSTNAYSFSTGERLRLEANVDFKATMYWDGSYNTSRLETPTIVVPENALALVAVAALIPIVMGAKKRRKHKQLAFVKRH